MLEPVAKPMMPDDDESDTDFMHTRLPKALGERVDRLQKYTDEGIVSRKAFVAEAVREKLERVEARVMERAGFYAWLDEQSKASKLPRRKS